MICFMTKVPLLTLLAVGTMFQCLPSTPKSQPTFTQTLHPCWENYFPSPGCLVFIDLVLVSLSSLHLPPCFPFVVVLPAHGPVGITVFSLDCELPEVIPVVITAYPATKCVLSTRVQRKLVTFLVVGVDRRESC